MSVSTCVVLTLLLVLESPRFPWLAPFLWLLWFSDSVGGHSPCRCYLTVYRTAALLGTELPEKYLEENLFRCLLCPKRIPRGLSGKRIPGSTSTTRLAAWALVAALDGDNNLRIHHRTLLRHRIFLQMWLTSPTTWILFLSLEDGGGVVLGNVDVNLLKHMMSPPPPNRIVQSE
jgi:hypothetical protein